MKIDYVDFFLKFIESKKKFAIGLQKKNERTDVGGVLLTKDSIVEIFNAKFNSEMEYGYINCGVYMMRRELLESWMNGVYKISLEEQLIPCLIKSGIDIFGYSKIENLVLEEPDDFTDKKSGIVGLFSTGKSRKKHSKKLNVVEYDESARRFPKNNIPTSSN
jgi:hypothetical protein